MFTRDEVERAKYQARHMAMLDEISALEEEFQKGMQQGIEKGMQQGIKDGLKLALKIKFGQRAQALYARLDQINDLAQLKEFKRALAQASELDQLSNLLS